MHEIYESGALSGELRSRWGEEVVPEGRVDRAAVARHAFASEEDRRWLEALLWPRVGERMAAWREGLESAEPRPVAAVVEVPLLFEAGLDAAFDATIAVVTDEAVARGRAGERGHEAVAARAARQLPQAEKARRATYAVVNDGSVEDLERSLSEILVKLRR